MNNKNCQKGKPILEVESMPNDIATYRYNVNGVQTWYDNQPMVYQTQTDTILVADAINRLLEYKAERHKDTISAKELGSILHIADLGDVDITDVEDNSLFVYRKDSSCSGGCVGTSSVWHGWNAMDIGNQSASAQYPMAFSDSGVPKAIGTPTNANQYYQLGWNAGSKLSYSQPAVVASPPLDTDNKKWKLYMDPTTKALVVVKET